MVSVHVPPEVTDFCAELPTLGTKPVFRLPIGGAMIEPPVDTTKGTPGSCSLTQGLMAPIQTALAGLQPILTILDVIATMAQCVTLIPEVISNPFKVSDLLKCIPNLVAKIGGILALVPPFPQGFAQILTTVVDVLDFAVALLNCLIDTLASIQAALQQSERDIAALALLPAGPIRDEQARLIECAMALNAQQVSSATSSLGPIARVLCAIRGILLLAGPPGKELAAQLAFPDLSNLTALTDAINAISSIRDVLQSATEIVRSVGAPIGAPLPPPDLVFTCPLDEDASNFDTTPPEPLPIPTITGIIDVDTDAPITTFAQGSPNQEVVILGENFINTDQSIPYWGAAVLEGSVVEAGTQIRVVVPADVKLNTGNQLISIVNQPPGGAVSAFSGLDDPSSGQSTESEIQTSETFQVEVV